MPDLKLKRSFYIKHQLFAALALLSLIPIFIVSYFAQNVMWRASVSFISQNAHQNMLDVAQRVNDYFQHEIKSINDLAFDTNFQKLISMNANTEAAQSIYIYNVRDMLQKFVQSRQEIAAVLLLDDSGHAFHISKDLTVFNYAFDFAKDPLYRRVNSFNHPQLIGPHMPPYYMLKPTDEVISLVIPIKNFINYSIGSWIVIELNNRSVEQLIGQMSMNQTGSVLLFNGDNGEIVNGNSIPGDSPQPLAAMINRSTSQAGAGELVVDHRKYQTVYRPLEFDNWTILRITPLDVLKKGLYLTRATTIGIALLSFLLALLFTVVFLKQLLKPLYALKYAMNAFSRGVVLRVQTNARNELGFLVKTFNQMLEDRQQLELELRQTSIREKDKELLQLQAQINPHFLFNTLGAIQALALQSRKAEVEEAIYCVAQILRYNARNDRGWALFQEEMDCIRHTRNIHYYRYGQEASILFDIPVAYLQIPVIKLSLQPFIENMLKYGWNASSGEHSFQASIAASDLDGLLIVRINDNGPGFEPQTLVTLQNLLISDAGQEDPYFTDHIGIWNVYRRLNLVYGKAFSMKIANHPDGGAEVTLAFPMALPPHSNSDKVK